MAVVLAKAVVTTPAGVRVTSGHSEMSETMGDFRCCTCECSRAGEVGSEYLFKTFVGTEMKNLNHVTAGWRDAVAETWEAMAGEKSSPSGHRGLDGRKCTV
ncbi:hypothetical protein E2C01_033775 [Portunus trituberculatus]|uniref:Uncharacterized protein n=1 Tax=Portunus trituberculatus TaxID=210409 RepID=A0A5B7F4N4_PORTR|nr:hypothetical protein [Portunus trituberculatus]